MNSFFAHIHYALQRRNNILKHPWNQMQKTRTGWSTPFSLIHKNMYESSHGTLIANSVTEAPGMVDAQMDREHSVEPPGGVKAIASAILGESTQNAKMAEATTETSTATPSAGPPPPTSVRANVVAFEISGDSTQLPGQYPNNVEMAVATTENSIAIPHLLTNILQHQLLLH
jgi:hypothetical protein